jgi:hypothetical protein
MRIGTKSVLFGVHCFALHPFLIALGWWKEYGTRAVYIGHRDREEYATDGWNEIEPNEGAPVYVSIFDPRLWVAFFVHDLGYLGKPNMDGPEGETHPEFGARIMRWLFGEPWGDFVLLHSRYYAKRLGRDVSPLCMADKWVGILEPAWLYLPRAQATGELAEFLDVGARRAASTDTNMTPEECAGMASRQPRRWHAAFQSYMRRWIAAHTGGQKDTWTGVRHGRDAA